MRTVFRADDFLTRILNRLAIVYDGGVHAKHRLMRYHDFFVDRISPGERVLDVGCGYGAVAHSVALRAGALVTGIDINAKNIDKAKRFFKHPHLTFVCSDALESVPDGPWDVILLSNILEHIEHRVEFLSGLQRLLEPKRWLIRVPMINRDWRVPLREELGLFYFSDKTHFTEYTNESFEKELISAGLRITHIQCNWGEIWAEAMTGSLSKDELSGRVQE